MFGNRSAQVLFAKLPNITQNCHKRLSELSMSSPCQFYFVLLTRRKRLLGNCLNKKRKKEDGMRILNRHD